MKNKIDNFLGVPLSKLIKLQENDKIGAELVIAAKNIKIILKHLYPDLPIKIKTSRYSGGNNLRVRWPDYENLGLAKKETPSKEILQSIESAFSMGQYDGMEESYNYEKQDMHIYGKAKFIFLESSDYDFTIEKLIKEEKENIAKSLKKIASKELTKKLKERI